VQQLNVFPGVARISIEPSVCDMLFRILFFFCFESYISWFAEDLLRLKLGGLEKLSQVLTPLLVSCLYGFLLNQLTPIDRSLS
jgi:hypothetical protein